jgi:hypothetical protein
MPKREIEVAGMVGMTHKQAKLTNMVAKCLTGKHGMCLDCAIKFAVAFVLGQSGKLLCAECDHACGWLFLIVKDGGGPVSELGPALANRPCTGRGEMGGRLPLTMHGVSIGSRPRRGNWGWGRFLH